MTEEMKKDHADINATYGTIGSTAGAIQEAILKMKEQEQLKQLLTEKAIKEAVIVCNRENKYKIKQALPGLCVLGTDACDEKIYMVVDQDLAAMIRANLKD